VSLTCTFRTIFCIISKLKAKARCLHIAYIFSSAQECDATKA